MKDSNAVQDFEALNTFSDFVVLKALTDLKHLKDCMNFMKFNESGSVPSGSILPLLPSVISCLKHTPPHTLAFPGFQRLEPLGTDPARRLMGCRDIAILRQRSTYKLEV